MLESAIWFLHPFTVQLLLNLWIGKGILRSSGSKRLPGLICLLLSASLLLISLIHFGSSGHGRGSPCLAAYCSWTPSSILLAFPDISWRRKGVSADSGKWHRGIKGFPARLLSPLVGSAHLSLCCGESRRDLNP